MGQTLLGGSQPGQPIDLLSPEQKSFLSGTLGSAAPQAADFYSQFLQPKGLEDYQALFQQTAVDPALKTLQQQILPTIQQSYAGADAGSSSALNQALAQAATDVTTNLGSQFGNFMQQQQGQQLSALGQLGGLTGIRGFEPVQQQTGGWLGPALKLAGDVAGTTAGGRVPYGTLVSAIMKLLGGGSTAAAE